MSTLRNLRLDDQSDESITVWMDVAERRVNVLTDALVDEMTQLVADWQSADLDRPIVIRSAKPSGFLAGADLGQLASFQTPDEVDRFLARGQGLLDRLSQLPHLTIAAIHGSCLGGGLELALACQSRIAQADPATKLGLPETRLGLTPAWGGTRRLPRLIGLGPALRMMLTGQPVGAGEANVMGIVDATARSDAFDEDLSNFVRDARRRGKRKPIVPVDSKPRVSNPSRIECLRQLAIARREYSPASGPTPAQAAVVRAVAAGFGLTAQDETTVVRDDFRRLVQGDEARQRLAEFLARRPKH